jgi:hypothetical protein
VTGPSSMPGRRGPRQPATAGPAALPTASAQTARPGHTAAMTQPPPTPTELVAAATAAASHEQARYEHLWAMTRAERIAAFYRHELTLGDCMAWSQRYPDEPPTGPCGEYLYILALTPEWLGET